MFDFPAVYQTHQLVIRECNNGAHGSPDDYIFEVNEEMGIPHAMVIQLQTEGITTLGDLADFEKDSLQQLADNLCHPGGRTPDPSPNAAAGTTIPMPTITFGAKSQKWLLVACNLIQYYNTTG